MATSVFNRAVADMSAQNDKSGVVVVATEAAHDLDPDRIVLSDDITAIRMHQLAITLRPLAGGSVGRPMLTASRWEIRKAIMSLCRTPPTMFEIEATDKSASIRAAFSAQAAAEDLSRKLRGVTVKIKGVKLHAFVREVSESATLCEGEDWAASFAGPKSKAFALPSTENGSDGEKEAAFDKLQPGKRPDTIVLRGVPANWLGSKGRAAEGADAPGLELIMGMLGPVRAVEVEPSAPSESSLDGDSASAATGGGGGGSSGSRRKGNKDGRTAAAIADFDVNALLENMPKPRALKGGGNRSAKGGVNGTTAVPAAIASGGSGGSGIAVGMRSGGNLMSVGLHVDAWVQFASFRGFRRALEALKGKTLQKAGAELLCEYRLGVDVTGYMTEARRRERAVLRAKQAQEEERRKAAIERARAQLVPLREGLQGLRDAAKEDGRLALEEAVKPTIQKVTGHVEKAEALLGVRVVVDEPAATAAVSHARGEIAIARLSIRKARSAVDRAEEEERQRLEREKDKELRDAARVTLAELEETLSRALDLIAAQRQHPGIKPQADKAAALLQELSKACSRDGGSKALETERVESPGRSRGNGGGLVAEARKATETAVTRACMLQRYLDTSARLEALRTAADAALTGSLPDSGGDSGNGNKNNNGIDDGDAHALVQKGSTPHRQASSDGDSIGNGGGISGKSSTMAGGSVLTAQLDEAGAILSRELESLSEGDLLLIWESAEEALSVANGMLETLKIVNAARHRLAETKTAVSDGDPQLRSSEGIMRLMAAAVMSVVRAHREGIVAKKSAVPATSSFLSSSSSSSHDAEQWRRAAQLADSDVAAAMREVDRVSNEIRAKQQREEDEKAWRKAEEERRIREEEAQRVERQARAVEREALKKKQAEARILAMELRRKEMIAQVKNKAARKRLREQFISQRKASDSPTGMGKKASPRAEKRAKRTDLPASAPVADRWTLEEGLGGATSNNDTRSSPPAPSTVTAVPLNTEAIATERGALAAPSLPARGSGGNEEVEAAPRVEEGSSPTSAAAVVSAGLSSAGEDRWGMDDGAADLAERGVELENGFGGEGPYLPMPSSSASPLLSGGDGGRRGRKRSRQAWGEKDQAEWLELVSKRVRSTVAGGASEGWGAVEASNEAEDKDEEDPVAMGAIADDGRDTAVDDEGVANHAAHGHTSAPPTAAAAAAAPAAKGGKVEAELRLRLLAAMTEKSKARAKARGKAS